MCPMNSCVSWNQKPKSCSSRNSAVDLKEVFARLRTDMGMDLAFNKPGGLSSDIVKEIFECVLRPLGLEHHCAVGFIANPTSHFKARSDHPRSRTKTNALYPSLKNNPLPGDHTTIIVDFAKLHVPIRTRRSEMRRITDIQSASTPLNRDIRHLNQNKISTKFNFTGTYSIFGYSFLFTKRTKEREGTHH